MFVVATLANKNGFHIRSDLGAHGFIEENSTLSESVRNVLCPVANGKLYSIIESRLTDLNSGVLSALRILTSSLQK